MGGLEIRAVTLDLDETMLDRRATFLVFIRQQMARFDDLFADVDRGAYLRRVVQLDRDGYTPKEDVFASAARDSGLAQDAAELLPRDFKSRFPDECVAFPGLLVVLRKLKESGYRTAVITNGSAAIQQRKLDRMRIRSWLDYVSISEVEGVRKPDPEIFHRTLRRLDVAPEQAVHVGDNPRADISGAKAAGLRAIWHRSRRWDSAAEADAVIEGIEQLPDALDQLAMGLQRPNSKQRASA